MFDELSNTFIIKNVPGGIRTPNLLIRSQKLYPVELQALYLAKRHKYSDFPS